MSRERRYWGFRVDVNNPDYPEYYNAELIQGVLRQGWGWDENYCNLKRWNRKNVPQELRVNFRMYDEVKKGDIILVPRIPEWGTVTVAEATEDWNTGYQFEIDERKDDYGHRFPAKYLTYFSRHNEHVSEDVASTLRCRSRFWNMSHHGERIENILKQEHSILIGDQERRDRYTNAIRRAMNSVNFSIETKVHKELAEQFAGSGWEYAFVEGLRALFPYYQIERTGGRTESEHGTDILVTMPSPLQTVQYGIAIQVKDWQGVSGNIDGAITQLQKADYGWQKIREDLRIVEKIVIVTEAKLPEGYESDKDKIERENGIRILHSDDLKKLLRRMALITAAAIDE